MRKLKISLFVHDLASNPIVRAYPIARALKKAGYEVEILGFFMTGQDLYKPYREAVDAVGVRGSTRPLILFDIPKFAKMATGDIIYAFKPLWTTYWPALFASGFGFRKPLLLDIEDNELYFSFDEIKRFVKNHLIHGWNFINAPKYNLLLHPLTKLCTHKTVSSRALQRIYGGEIILHGPDESIFDPQRPECSKQICRKQFGLPQDAPLLLFAGMPYPHKGLDIVTKSLSNNRLKNCHLVLCGEKTHPEYTFAKETLGNRCHIIGYLPNNMMPQILAAVDIVPIIQRPNAFTECQLPAKLLEAIAMEKAIIATRVSDLPQILGEGESMPRGWVIPPSDTEAFISAVEEILSNPNEIQKRGMAARQYFLNNASLNANAQKMEKLLRRVNIKR